MKHALYRAIACGIFVIILLPFVHSVDPSMKSLSVMGLLKSGDVAFYLYCVGAGISAGVMYVLVRPHYARYMENHDAFGFENPSHKFGMLALIGGLSGVSFVLGEVLVETCYRLYYYHAMMLPIYEEWMFLWNIWAWQVAAATALAGLVLEFGMSGFWKQKPKATQPLSGFHRRGV